MRLVSRLPQTPVSGGSQTAASTGSAVHLAPEALRERLIKAVSDAAEAKPGSEKERYGRYAFGAQFAEVRVDVDLGQIKVSPMVGCFGRGKILKPKTARS